ncbi:PAS domain-containing protein [Azospirillum griseum]|uniref:PAS domain-containing protein n=1 Tax=Azospirillum griseum TaxID=2496639 RepID=A0A431VDJ5_9PROT|nr:PAS domain-containing protein [Azospirillum griseum]RTR17205.1 PAS domain-containing protein [Azospirillum griseum]
MSHAFAKDSRACAACVSWGGDRALSEDNTLVRVGRHGAEGECRTASSHDYRKVTKAYHTCAAWSPLPTLKKHGGRIGGPTPTSGGPAGPSVFVAGQSAAASGAGAATAQATPATTAAPGVSAAAVVEAEALPCRADPLDVEQTPQVRVLYTHWLRLKRKRAIPLVREIDTAQIRETVPRVCLMEPTADGDFVYRSCGRALQRRLPQRATTRRVTECHPPQAAERWLADLRACLDSGEPRCLMVRDDPMLPGTRFVELLLPLADEEGGKATRILAYRHVPGG